MSMFGSVKDVVVGKAMRLASDPRLTKMVSDPRVMNAAMKALSMTGNVRNELSKATRMAAGIFGIATQEEVASLRSTIQNLEDTVATLEARAARSESR
jgi:polyhydroxyalkanoate synthesis regulator phasin